MVNARYVKTIGPVPEEHIILLKKIPSPISLVLVLLISFHALSQESLSHLQESPAHHNSNVKTLSELGNLYHSDKAYYHNFTPTYQQYFLPLREKPIKFLEIGFYHGASARMWDTFFTQATSLHFIDIDPAFFNYMADLSGRCHLHMVDQADEKALAALICNIGGDFDIIIDDGGHTMNQQITSFKALFPYVKSGGMYIIEDLHTSYWELFGSLGTYAEPKASSRSTINFLKDLIDELNYSGARTVRADKDQLPQSLTDTFNYYQKHIASMHFYTSLCIIVKR